AVTIRGFMPAVMKPMPKQSQSHPLIASTRGQRRHHDIRFTTRRGKERRMTKPKTVSDLTEIEEDNVTELHTAPVATEAIAKPGAFDLNKFKSKHAAAAAGVETLLTALPHHSISQAKDFVRLHCDEDAYWSPELCFVNVPIKGAKRDSLHLIDEDLAMNFLP